MVGRRNLLSFWGPTYFEGLLLLVLGSLGGEMILSPSSPTVIFVPYPPWGHPNQNFFYNFPKTKKTELCQSTPLEFSMEPLKIGQFGKGGSFWKPSLSGSMLNFGVDLLLVSGRLYRDSWHFFQNHVQEKNGKKSEQWNFRAPGCFGYIWGWNTTQVYRRI